MNKLTTDSGSTVCNDIAELDRGIENIERMREQIKRTVGFLMRAAANVARTRTGRPKRCNPEALLAALQGVFTDVWRFEGKEFGWSVYVNTDCEIQVRYFRLVDEDNTDRALYAGSSCYEYEIPASMVQRLWSDRQVLVDGFYKNVPEIAVHAAPFIEAAKVTFPTAPAPVTA